MRGFSLIELIISLAIVSVVGTVTVTAYNGSKQAGIPLHNSYVYIDALRQAVLRARTLMYDNSWGVKIGTSTVTVFSGTSYAARVTQFDSIYQIASSGATTTGVTEIDFAKFTGIPSAYGTTTFSNAYASSSVTVTSLGYITY